ncbi:MAG: hypothetical protein E7311_02875 [Clostridiales bacterium]|nr:hypothetical protein [Clostridiales bacterium]
MQREVKLTRFIGHEVWNPDTFLSIDKHGKVSLKLFIAKLRNWKKVFVLKKDAIMLYEKYSKSEFENFCKKHPKIPWNTTFSVKAGTNNEFTIYCDYPVSYEQLQEKIRYFCNIPVERFTYCEDLDFYNELLSKEYVNSTLRNSGVCVGDNAVILKNDKYLVTSKVDNLKLKFIISLETLEFFRFTKNLELRNFINVFWESIPEFMFGTFKTNSKGTPLFYPCAKSNAKHILIRMLTAKDLSSEVEPVPNPLYEEFVKPKYFAIIPIDTTIEYDEDNI